MKRSAKERKSVPLGKFLARRAAPRPRARESPAMPRAHSPSWLADSSSSPSMSPMTPRVPRRKGRSAPPPAPKKRKVPARAPALEPVHEECLADDYDATGTYSAGGPRRDSLLVGLPLGFLEFIVLNGPRVRAQHKLCPMLHTTALDTRSPRHAAHASISGARSCWTCGSCCRSARAPATK